VVNKEIFANSLSTWVNLSPNSSKGQISLYGPDLRSLSETRTCLRPAVSDKVQLGPTWFTTSLRTFVVQTYPFNFDM